jgi:hypothetical protein
MRALRLARPDAHMFLIPKNLAFKSFYKIYNITLWRTLLRDIWSYAVVCDDTS